MRFIHFIVNADGVTKKNGEFNFLVFKKEKKETIKIYKNMP